MKKYYLVFGLLAFGYISAQETVVDPSFGTAGEVTVEFGNNSSKVNAIVIQPDGKMIFGGTSNSQIALARINPNGTLDTNFGTAGKVLTNLNGSSDYLDAMVLQPDGKLIAVGNISNSALGNISDFAVLRYNTNGTLDTSFSGDGIVSTDFANLPDRAKHVTLQPDGKILVAGEARDVNPQSVGGTDTKFCLARYLPNGALDTSFNGNGKVMVSFYIEPDIDDNSNYGRVVVVAPDGKIILGGISDVEFAMVRLNIDGSIDSTFGDEGRVVTDLGLNGSNLTELNAIKIMDDGRILLAGSKSVGYDEGDGFLVTRYSPDGVLDTGFGENGLVVTDFNYEDDIAHEVFVLPDGKILLAGTGANKFALARYNADGTKDTSFNTFGRFSTGVSYRKASGAVMQPDGKVVIAGSYLNDMFAMRYDMSGNLSVTEREDSRFKIFPNPVSDVLHIATSSAQIITFRLFDMLGKELKTITSEVSKETQINLEGMASGTYILRAEGVDGKTESHTIIRK